MEFPDFEEFIASLNARPRATKDIDVLVDRSAANARRVRACLLEFLGAPAPNITEAKLRDPRTLIVLGVPPVRIDVLTSVDGVPSFAAAWKRRAEGRYGGTTAHFLSLADLMAAKAATGRPQDLADLDVLERIAARRGAPKPTHPKQTSRRKRSK